MGKISKKTKLYNGTRCIKCSSTEKYVSTGSCADCTRKYAREQYMKFPEFYKQRHKDLYPIRKDFIKDSKLRATYGISLETFNTILVNQNNVCAICKDVCPSKRSLCVDHNHKTNKVRGLLCVMCNRAIGNFKDDIILLERAIEYLKTHDRK